MTDQEKADVMVSILAVAMGVGGPEDIERIKRYEEEELAKSRKVIENPKLDTEVSVTMTLRELGIAQVSLINYKEMVKSAAEKANGERAEAYRNSIVILQSVISKLHSIGKEVGDAIFTYDDLHPE